MGLNALFKALGDNTRREILRLLTQKALTAGEIAEAFDLSRATISHHLSVLKDAGLVLDERQGQYIVYSLNTTVFQEVAAWVLDLRRTFLKRIEPGKERLRGKGKGE